MRSAPFPAVLLAGFASTAGQILVLRELLVLFYGNELSTGLIFAGWLLWTALGSTLAGRFHKKMNPDGVGLAAALSFLALLLPLTVLFIRASRLIWAIPVGEIVRPGLMLGITLSVTAPFCLASGMVFALAWTQAGAGNADKDGRPIAIYLGEAAGAAVGGLFYTFVLLPAVSAVAAALIVAAIVLAGCIALPKPRRSDRRATQAVTGTCLAALVLLGIGLTFSPVLDDASRRLQWGSNFLFARDTPFHNLALLREADQYSLFGNGLLLFSFPDPQTAEYCVHLPLLQHPNPAAVLLIGGDAPRLAAEAVKHPGLERLDCVEPDPEIIRIADELSAGPPRAALGDPRVHLFHEDAASFVRTRKHGYDVIVLNLGNPLTAEMNRFYTVEFFSGIRGRLNPGGIFSFAVSSSPDMIGPVQARFLRSLEVTLREVFPTVLVIPGESARFLGTDPDGRLLSDPRELIDRISARRLDLKFVREYYLFDYLNPLRIAYLANVLQETEGVKVNRDFEPRCYFHNLAVWGAQLHPSIGSALNRLSGAGQGVLWGALGALSLAILVTFATGRAGYSRAVAMNVMIVGAAQMTLEIVLLVGFQILAGFVYTQLALIVSFYMAGLASGGAVTAFGAKRIENGAPGMAAVQAAFSALLVATMPIMSALRTYLEESSDAIALVKFVFSALAFTAGLLGGLHFGLAVTVRTGTSPAVNLKGPALYAADLAGSAGGVVLASLFLVPVYGLAATLKALAVLCLACSLTLIPRRT